ncbi:MAG: RNA polymerase sigma factor, partial [Gemmataceae bacterium]
MDDSVRLLARWREGDQRAAAELFSRHASRLIALARQRLHGKLARRVDPEDVVHSVYRSFFVRAKEGRFDLERGGDLWRLLVAMTFHKVCREVERHSAAKRAIKKEQAFGSEDSLHLLQPDMLSREPSPAESIVLAEELEGMMLGLEPRDRLIFELRLQGHNVKEIAEAAGCSVRTVKYTLADIKI